MNAARRRLSCAIIAIAVTGVSAGCTTPSFHETPIQSEKQEISPMTPDESRAEIRDIYEATKEIVGGDWKIGTDTWLDYSRDDEQIAGYGFFAQRRAQPLNDTPATVARDVQKLWKERGHPVTIVHDDKMTPPRLILSDPAWLTGTEDDGFLLQFSVGKDYADFSADGRHIHGDDYELRMRQTG